MDYREIRFHTDQNMSEILIALLSEEGYEMFEELSDGLKAYIPAGDFDEVRLLKVISAPGLPENIAYENTFIESRNWNKTWENNFEPVEIAGQIYIRAPFHKAGHHKIEIIIEPKMSFGTGHHATTSMMAELMFGLDMKKKEVLDMGCGSGILAILASKLAAKKVLAVDNDLWAIENCKENCERNKTGNIEIKHGESETIRGAVFDIILANINRNVLISEMKNYADSLSAKGKLLLSGFLVEDKNVIVDKASEYGLRPELVMEKLNWIAIQFEK
jgi:ribosomal protein L11 methyltransferase